ncbi:MAG: TetR/AcrR family transcriptional regulator [Spongiibacteraceae bacterium]
MQKPAPRHQTAKGQITRERILDAAEILFLEHGFVKASLRDIAAAAGIELGLLSYYFKSKEALIKEAFERQLLHAYGLQRDALEQLVARRKSAATVEEILHAYSRDILEKVAQGDRGLLFVFRFSLLHRHPGLSPEAYAPAHDYHRPVRQAFLDALARAMPDYPKEKLLWSFDAFESIFIALLTDRKGSADLPLLHSPHAQKYLVSYCAAGFRELKTAAIKSVRTRRTT